ncbi:MAG: histone deacetylase, partial [Chloroflexota bacterium]
MATGMIYGPIYLEHDTGTHIENAGRLKSIISVLERSGFKNDLITIEPQAAPLEKLATVHSREHIDDMKRLSHEDARWLTLDTVISRASYDVALYAAGGAIQAVDLVMRGELDNAFALVRPPGHHATHREAMGFCL